MTSSSTFRKRSGNGPVFQSDDDLNQMRQVLAVARLYHIHHVRQSDIAKQLGISQAGVSRLLKLAEDGEIVRTIVLSPEGMFPDLEDGLSRKYGLAKVAVVETGNNEDDIPRALGTYAANMLSGDFKGEIVGFTSWSVTLREMARLMPIEVNSPVTHVVEMLGDLGSPTLQHEATLATSQLSYALTADPVFLRTPGVARSSSIRAMSLTDVYVRRAMEMFDRIDVAMIGVGPADFHGPLEEHDNFFKSEQLAEIRSQGAAGQILQRFIDSEGRPIKTPLDDLVVGVSLDQIRKAGHRMLIAGGSSKHEPIAAALAGKWIDTLVTDVGVAKYLLNRTS